MNRTLREANFKSWYANDSGFSINTSDTESITKVQSYQENKIPFGVTTNSRTYLHYFRDGVQQKADITTQLTNFVNTRANNGPGFSESYKPEPIEFPDGIFYIVGANADVKEGVVTQFRNVEGYIVVNE